MRIVVQRVSEASVSVGGVTTASIGPGLLVLLGIEVGDGEEAAEYLARKTALLRIFGDEAGKMNLSVMDTGGSVLVVSQFTLLGDCRKGMRPGYERAERPERARQLYNLYVESLRNKGIAVETGVFQASMKVGSINDGPVTLICESPSKQGHSLIR